MLTTPWCDDDGVAPASSAWNLRRWYAFICHRVVRRIPGWVTAINGAAFVTMAVSAHRGRGTVPQPFSSCGMAGQLCAGGRSKLMIHLSHVLHACFVAALLNIRDMAAFGEWCRFYFALDDGTRCWSSCRSIPSDFNDKIAHALCVLESRNTFKRHNFRRVHPAILQCLTARRGASQREHGRYY